MSSPFHATSDMQSVVAQTASSNPTDNMNVSPSVWSYVTVSKFFVTLWAISVVIGLVILLVPENRKLPLVTRSGWAIDGSIIQNLRPTERDVSRSILQDPQTVFWSSLTETGAASGRAVSAAFRPPRFLAVPFVGFPAQSGIELYLECLRNQKQLRIAHGNAHDRWVERTIWLPASWCRRSEVRLVASSSSPQRESFIIVGTPFKSSRLSWWKESVFIVVFIHALACLLLLGPGFVAASMAGIRDVERSLLVALPATLLMGYAVFFAFYYGSTLTHFGVVLFMILVLLATGVKHRHLFIHLSRNVSAVPFHLFFALSLSYALLLYSADLGVGSFAANYRFAPAVWSTDNQLPQIVAEALYRHDPIASLLGTEWRVSDRPPLMSGVFLLARGLWEPFIAIGDNSRLLFYFYQVTGIVASTAWVLPVYLLLKSVQTSSREASLIVLALAITSPVVFNSTYIWPKMLSGALALAAFVTYLSVEQDRPHHALVRAAFVGLLVALALLAHGGVVFGLIPLAVLLAIRRRPNRIRGLVVPIAVIAVALVPWLLWQRFEDPPGNTLTKFALAGTFGLGEETKGVISTIRDAYSRLSFDEWFLLRWQALMTLFGAFRPPLVSWLWLSPSDFLGQLRLADFAFVFPSLGLGNLSWLVFAIGLLRRGRDEPLTQIRVSRFAWWTVIGVSGIAINVLVTWYIHTSWHQSYVSLLLMLVGLYSGLLLKSQPLRGMILLGQFAYFGVVWLWSPLVNVPWRPDHIAGWLLSALGTWLVVIPKSDTLKKSVIRKCFGTRYFKWGARVR